MRTLITVITDKILNYSNLMITSINFQDKNILDSNNNISLYRVGLGIITIISVKCRKKQRGRNYSIIRSVPLTFDIVT